MASPSIWARGSSPESARSAPRWLPVGGNVEFSGQCGRTPVRKISALSMAPVRPAGTAEYEDSADHYGNNHTDDHPGLCRTHGESYHPPLIKPHMASSPCGYRLAAGR